MTAVECSDGRGSPTRSAAAQERLLAPQPPDSDGFGAAVDDETTKALGHAAAGLENGCSAVCSTAAGGGAGGGGSTELKKCDKRETWSSGLEFLFSMIGFAVDLANVWRFPYYCYRNGGGAFLVPYFLMLALGALPLFYMEVLLGQFHKQGPISLWRIVPIFKGIGWAIVSVSYMVSFYYNVVIGWSFYYLFASFTAQLPWTLCNQEWNTCKCWDGVGPQNRTECANVSINASTGISSSIQYFERRMLSAHESIGIEDMGAPRWDVTLCVLLAYCIMYFSLWKGIKTSGKVVYVTAIAPYVLMTILFVRGLFLDGSADGLYFYANPDFTRLGDPQVWIDAAIQVFYSVGAGFGVHLSMASYNDFHNNSYRDCLITVAVNCMTSIFSGCVVFVYLGYMAHMKHVDISKVAQQGQGLVFEVYPEAIATLPGSTVWAILFFIMLITLGMDSAMGGMESVLTGIIDEFGSILKKYRFHREVCTFVIVAISFLVAVASCTSGGIFLVTLFDSYAAGASLLIVVLCESIAVAWFYGLDNFLQDATDMLKFTPGIYWRICWKFLSPLFLAGIVVASIVTSAPLSYKMSDREVIYPQWANTTGWLMVSFSVLWVPVFVVYEIVVAPGRSVAEKLALSVSPTWEREQVLRGTLKPKCYSWRHWLTLGKDMKPREAIELKEMVSA